MMIGVMNRKRAEGNLVSYLGFTAFKMQRIVPWSGTPVLAAVLCVACSTTRSSEHPIAKRGLRDGTVGCYLVRIEGPATENPLGASAVIELQSASISVERPYLRRIAVIGPRDSMDLPLRVWSADSTSDSIRISMGMPFAGVTVVIDPSSGTGVATSHGDLKSIPAASGLATLSRMVCGAP
jgi:hypothetical protein